MNRVLSLMCALGIYALCGTVWAASGKSDTTCVQTDAVTLVCSTTTRLTLPPGVNLADISLPSGTASGPACSSLTASPSTQIPANTPTIISLSVNGCPTSSAYTYAWAAPVSAGVTGATTNSVVTLSASAPTQLYSVQVCFTANPGACSTYTATVSVVPSIVIPALTGCAVTPATASVVVGATTSLSATCNAGTASGSGVTYQWYRNQAAVAGATSSTYSLSASDTAIIGNLTYTVQIANGAPSGASPSATVVVTARVVDVIDYCPGVPVKLFFNASESYKKIYTTDYGSSPPGSTFVVAVDVTANDSTVGRYLAEVGYSDFGATRSGRYVTMSKSKCDFTETANWISVNVGGVKLADNAGGGTVAMGAETRPASAKLTPGRWYLNIQNAPGACPSYVSSCDAVIGWAN